MHLGIIKITYNRTAQPRCYHNAFYALAKPVGQSEQTALVGRRDFVENEVFERGGA